MKDFSKSSPVLIEWEDPYSGLAHWHDISELSPKPLICRSVGWIVSRANGCIVLMAHLAPPRDDGGQSGFGDVTIPRRAIKTIRSLAPAKKNKSKRS